MTGPYNLDARLKRLEASIDQAADTARDAGILAIQGQHMPDYSERIEALEKDVKRLKDHLGLADQVPAYENYEIPF